MGADKPSLKSRQDISLMREAGRIVAETLALIAEQTRPGVSTAELDRLAYEHIRARGAAPSFKGYNGFPASICASVNDEIVHGIPGPRVLQEGDLFSADCGAFYRGFHADAAITIGVGRMDPALQQMIDHGWEALAEGIKRARPGNRVDDIGAAIQQSLLSHGYGVVGDGLAGHGVGRRLHESPTVNNYGVWGHGPRLLPGMTLAIEPMFTQRSAKWNMLEDGWTVVTRDQSLAVHVEHTVAITEGEPEVLTQL